MQKLADAPFLSQGMEAPGPCVKAMPPSCFFFKASLALLVSQIGPVKELAQKFSHTHHISVTGLRKTSGKDISRMTSQNSGYPRVFCPPLLC